MMIALNCHAKLGGEEKGAVEGGVRNNLRYEEGDVDDDGIVRTRKEGARGPRGDPCKHGRVLISRKT